VTVIQCDYDIQSVETYTSDTGIPREGWKASGFGGTSFVPVFNYVNEHMGELNPNCLIYLTDGYGDAPDNPPPYPVMWIISPGGYNSCPYGTVAHMKNSENL
jgi:predicted metal-dependent peptidase